MARWQIIEAEKIFREKNLKNGIQRLRSCSTVPRGCVPRIRLWPLERDDHSAVLIGAGGERRSGWPASVLANDASTRIDR